jgi:hypothetical protein
MARLPHTATSLGTARSDDRGPMVLEGAQASETNQKLVLAQIVWAGLGFSSRGSVRTVSSLLRKSRSS